MIVKIEEIPSQNDIEVTVTYPRKNKTVERIVSFLRTVEAQIECYFDNKIKMVNVSDIYYFESMGDVTRVFCEKENYETKLRLYQLNEKLSDKGFIQISKYCILNINKLKYFRPILNSRMEVVLINGIKLFINRTYLINIKSRLEND